MVKWLENNATKIIITLVIAIFLSLNIVYMQGLKGDIVSLRNKVDSKLTAIQDTQDTGFNLMFRGLVLIMEQLVDLSKSTLYIIDQNRANTQKTIQSTVINQNKPTYEELKSHTVFIVGCSGKKIKGNQLTYPVGDDGVCWSGTGAVIKTTDKETYIITNNHVAGRGEDDVTLYVNNDRIKEPATIVKYHEYADLAVIKVNTKLKDKTAVPGYALTNIQDTVYIVGNPLGNKMTYSEGVVANFIGTDILIQAPLIFGNSGSAIINKDGKLVGLCYALQTYPGFFGIPMPQITHSLCVDGITIQTFLKDLGLYNE